MKLALYRKYRPTRFDEVVGQESVTAALKNQLRAGKLGHAYLFTGVRGTGKTSLAKILAKAANCLDLQDGEPCGKCEICRGIDNGTVLDVTEIDAASNNRVDDVRDILEEVSYAPSVARMRVYIVDEVHMLTPQAFNALLKTLEEPPKHVLFILATTEIQKMPATILSRCQRFDLKRIPEEKIAARLKEVALREDIDLTDGAATLIARLADGALRDALSILDTSASLGGTVDEQTVQRLTGVTDRTYLFQLSDALKSGDLTGTVRILQQLYSDGIEPGRLLNELIRHYRNLLMVRVGKVTLNDCSNEMQKRYEFESGKFADADLLKNLSVLSDAADKMSRSLDREVTIELAVLSLVEKMGRQVTREPAVREPIIDKTAPPVQNPADNTKDLPEPVRRPEPMPEEAIDEKPPVSDPDLPDQMAFDLPAPENSGSDLLPDWGEIIALVRKKNGMLGSVLSKSKAHLDGKRVLIEASEVAMKFIRENQESNQTLKEAIAEVTGKYYPIGPWKKKEQPAVDTNDGLQKFLKAAESAGVDIVRR